MRDDVLKWLESINLDINKINHKWGIKSISLVEAAEYVYDRIKRGEYIKPIRIGWEIRSIAQSIARRGDTEKIKSLKSAHETILDLRAKIAALETELAYSRLSFMSKVWAKIKGILK